MVINQEDMLCRVSECYTFKMSCCLFVVLSTQIFQIGPLIMAVTLVQVQVTSSSPILPDLTNAVTSLAPHIGSLAPDLLQVWWKLVPIFKDFLSFYQAVCGGCGCSGCGCGGCGFIRPPSTSASFTFSSTGVTGETGALVALVPGVGLGILKALLIGTIKCSSDLRQIRNKIWIFS